MNAISCKHQSASATAVAKRTKEGKIKKYLVDSSYGSKY
jgi:hypothetical protein